MKPRLLAAASAARLLDVLPADCLQERQNDSPTVGTFLRSAAAHPAGQRSSDKSDLLAAMGVPDLLADR